MQSGPDLTAPSGDHIVSISPGDGEPGELFQNMTLKPENTSLKERITSSMRVGNFPLMGLETGIIEDRLSLQMIKWGQNPS